MFLLKELKEDFLESRSYIARMLTFFVTAVVFLVVLLSASTVALLNLADTIGATGVDFNGGANSVLAVFVFGYASLFFLPISIFQYGEDMHEEIPLDSIVDICLTLLTSALARIFYVTGLLLILALVML